MKRLLLLLTLIVTLFSCRKVDNFAPNVPDTPLPTKRNVSGVVQKGPFLKGTSILMTELDTSLTQTGRIFEANILSDIGSFSIDSITLSSNFARFSASGFYFNEFSGSTSNSQLTLQAITNVTSPNININVLTHLEKPRVEYLVKSQRMSFVDAKRKAQREILDAFSFNTDTLLNNSENLNITTNSNDNAILLAISLIVQGDRGVGDFTALLGGLQGDLLANGTFSTRLQDSLRSSIRKLNVFNIRQNLVNKYTSLGVNAQIPTFENYVTKYLRSVSEVDTTGGPTDGLVGFWSFNGDLRDGSGNGWDGAGTGVTLAPDRFGKPNKSYLFNGTPGTKVETSFPGIFSERRSVSFWSKHGAIGNSEHIVTWGLPGLYSAYTIHLQISPEGKPCISLSFGGAFIGAHTNTVKDNLWHHYAITYNDTNDSMQVVSILNKVNIFIDGVHYENDVRYNIPSNLSRVNTKPGLNLVIGEYNATAQDWRTFRGNIDDVRVYNRALTEQEIITLASN